VPGISYELMRSKIFIACQHALGCKARYCFTISICPSVRL